jgi:hypothetical protein
MYVKRENRLKERIETSEAEDTRKVRTGGRELDF